MTDKKPKQLNCVICKKPIPITAFGWAGGNNAEPVAKGRCCDWCNSTVVVPTRIENMTAHRKGH